MAKFSARINDVINPQTLIVTVHLRGYRWWKIKTHVAICLVWVAAKLINAGFNCDSTKGDE
jgi:hypothetical protein